jgi:hypothetical protein
VLAGVGIFSPRCCLIGLEGCLWRELAFFFFFLVRKGIL